MGLLSRVVDARTPHVAETAGVLIPAASVRVTWSVLPTLTPSGTVTVTVWPVATALAGWPSKASTTCSPAAGNAATLLGVRATSQAATRPIARIEGVRDRAESEGAVTTNVVVVSTPSPSVHTPTV